MTENMNKTTDTTTADLPQAPNGHGTSNGAANGESHQGAAVNEGAAKDATPLSNKQKKAQRRAAAKDAAAATTAAAGSEQPTTAPTAPPLSSSEVSAAPLIATTSTEAPVEVPVGAPVSASVEAPVGAPVEAPVESLRIRLKIWTHPETAKRYLMPTAFMRDVVNGRPTSDVMVAYAMSEDGTMVVTLTAAQWNTMPFFYFQEDGPAPRATARPIDVITSRGRPG